MDARRVIIFILLSVGLMFIWDKYIDPQKPQTNTINTSSSNQSANNNVAAPTQINNDNANVSANGQLITVTTDLLQVQISTVGGNLQSVNLLSQGSQDNPKQPYALIANDASHTFIAQTGLVDNSGITLPTHNSLFVAEKYNYVLDTSQDSIKVDLKSEENNGIVVVKTYTFKRNSYVVNIGYQILNNSNTDLTGVSAYWRLLRDENTPSGDTKFVHTFTGAAYYTEEAKFNTLKLSNLVKNDVSYPEATDNGWVGFIQHYFAVLWLLNPYGTPNVCANGVNCRLNFKGVNNTFASAGVLTDLPTIKAHTNFAINVPLFAGPEEYKVLSSIAPHLELTKDYGWVYIFATPLFWLLVKLYAIVKNWGWAIILLTLVVKLVLYPLTRASYISMAKMKALAPKMEKIKEQYANDRVKMQQAVMQMYKNEKVNPIGGCLPMLLQIPVFIGLYWALLSSVELRQASFMWIHDLSRPDPYFILPVVLAISMFLQTFLNPPSADPVQAKMMRIMPVAFSVMFFFFPAGLVLYWLVNNVLSISQQWYVNNHVTLKRNNRQQKK